MEFYRSQILVCTGTGCASSNSHGIIAAFGEQHDQQHDCQKHHAGDDPKTDDKLPLPGCPLGFSLQSLASEFFGI